MPVAQFHEARISADVGVLDDLFAVNQFDRAVEDFLSATRGTRRGKSAR